MGQWVELTSGDGFVLPAWVARTDGVPRGAVVVLQEIFGVNSHIRAVTDWYAARGYLALAPSTFARVQKDVELGYGADDMQAGKALKAAAEALPAPAARAGAGAFRRARPLDPGGRGAGLCACPPRGAGRGLRRRPRLQLRPARQP